MRLGSAPIHLISGTLAHRIYGDAEIIYERHRHRYQVNPKYVEDLESAGFKVSGYGGEGFPEIMELKDHRFFLGIQAHPEFKSRPLKPAPLFKEFLTAAAEGTH